MQFISAMEPTTALAVALVFLGAGFIKGIVAIGLPVIAVSLLSHIIGVRESIYITLAPAILTSLAQALMGPALKQTIIRLSPLLATGCIAIGIATQVTAKADPRILAVVVGSLIAVYALVSLAKVRFPEPGRYEKYWSPAIGLIGGTLGGMSGMFAMPAVPYIQSLRQHREVMIQSIAVWFVAGALVMLAVLGVRGVYTPELVGLSTIAVITSLAGTWIGTMARGRMSDGLFLNVFFVAFLLLGAFIVWKGLSGNM